MEGLVRTTWVIRPLAPSDVAAVLDIAASSPEAAQWSGRDFERACRSEFASWVVETGTTPAGFLVARCAADQMEILNLAVEPSSRRRGTASRLLEAVLTSGRQEGARTVFLEVRTSNAGAIAFYRRHGFEVSGRRAGYYFDPKEDALVLTRELV